MLFFLFSPENRIRHFMQIISIGDHLQEMSKPVFWEKQEKHFRMWSAENFTQIAIKVKVSFYVYSSLRHLLWSGIIFCNI